MNVLVSLILFVVGLALVIFFAEQVVKTVVATSLHFGISAFLVSVVFIGFDPDNLSVGVAASFQGSVGLAWGSIIGAAMVASAFAFGVSALFAPMKFEQAPKQILVLPVLAVSLLGILGFDGQLSRIDGILLLVAFALSVVWLVRLGRKGFDLKPSGEVAKGIERAGRFNRWVYVGILIVSLFGIVIGSELLVTSTQTLLAAAGLSETFFGMTILAFLVSIEELARELPAALKGRPEISFGNVVGSILAMFLLNAGFIALLKPIELNAQVLGFYLPYAWITVVTIAAMMTLKKISRWAGGLLILIYLGFVAASYLVQ